MNIVKVRHFPYALPFTRTLRTARGRFSHRRGSLLMVQDSDGRCGWGDAASWPGFGSNSDELASAMAALSDDDSPLLKKQFGNLMEVEHWLSQQCMPPEATYAAELALLDLIGQQHRQAIAQLLWPEPSSQLSCHTLVVDLPPPSATHLKLKLGELTLDEDEARIAQVRAAAPPDAKLRLDIAGAWSEAQARTAIKRFAPYNIDCIEQPLAPGDLEAVQRLREQANRFRIRIALDESVTRENDIDALIAAKAADELVLKPMFLGGLLKTRQIAKRAAQENLSVTVTNALESAIGRCGTLHLAAGLPGVHGLGSALARDLADAPECGGAYIAVPRGSGLGTSPLDKATPSPATTLKSDAHSTSVPNPLQSSAMARPDHIALSTESQNLSYQQLRQAVAQQAGALQARGVKPGMTVGLCGPPNAHWVVHWHAIAWLGASAAPLPHKAPPEEHSRLIRAIRPHVVLHSDQPLVDAPFAEERFWPLDEIRTVVFTSGTSGGAKPIALTTQQLLFSAVGSAIRLGHHLDDRWLCCLPLHHIGGLSILTRAALLGITVLLSERFEPASVARRLDDGDATMVSLVPTMLERVLDARADTPFPSSLRVILLGGAPAPAALLDRCRRIGAPVALSWGMTEAASQIATRFAGDLSDTPGAGPPLSFARVDTEEGTLSVRGPLVGGQLLSNDRGWVDERHEVHLSGRADDIIISGGEKIAPTEVEAVLRTHPAIEDAIVLGTPSQRWGQRPIALLEGPEADRPSSSSIHEWCRHHLAPFKTPDAFGWCARLPRSEMGKVSRRAALALLGQLGLVGDQTELSQPITKDIRHPDRPKAVDADECMDHTSGGTHLSVRSTQGERKSDRLAPQALHFEGDIDPLLHANRPLEVGLGMNERHAELLAVKHPLDVAVDSHEHLFVGGVAELKYAREEHNSGAVHLKKTSSNLMNEGHDDDAR